ncbi:glycosyltransferase [Bacillaceae bacterium S4-13-58]
MKKTILYIGGMEFPDKNAAAQRVIANCKIFEDLGYRVILAGMNKLIPYDFDHLPIKEKSVHNFNLYSRPYPKNTKQWIQYMIDINWIKKIIKSNSEENIVAIVAYNYPSVALLKLQRYAEKNKIKLIADCTEWYGNKNISKSIDTFFRMRYVQKKVRNVICISDYLEEYYSSNNCITVNVPSLVDKMDIKWEKETAFKSSNPMVFSYVGSPGITKEKDRLDFIIKAFYELKKSGYNFLFKIVGISKEEFLNMFPTYQAILLALNKHVIFLGRMSHLDSLSIVKKSDFTVFARMENRVTMAGFPTKLAESFSCGTPVVTNPTSNISKFIYTGKNGYLAKDCSLNSLKEAIEHALNTDSVTLEKMHIYCSDLNPLDYRNFIDDLNTFINRVI